MSVLENIAGTWRPGTLWENVAGTWRKGTLWENISGTWTKDAAGSGGGALAASAMPSAVYGSVSRKAPSTVNTNNTTVTATGGQAPYSFAWAPNTGWTISNPSSATTSFSTTVGAGDNKTTSFECTITDTSGATTTVLVDAEVDNYYSGGALA